MGDASAAGTIRVGDRTVCRLGYGAMRLTGPNILGEPPDRDAAKRVLRRALELGVDFVDTAHAYGPLTNERLIGEEIGADEPVLVATKGGSVRSESGGWPAAGRPDQLREQVETSLRLLRRDALDLVQLHQVDPQVPIEDSVGAYAELRDEGKVRLVGLSNVSVAELERARAVTEIASVQNRYSVADRASDDVVDACEAAGIVFIPWFPLGAGRLPDALDAVARARDATPFQVALAWLLRRSPAILPIPGTSSLEHLEENVAAASLELTDEDLAALDALST